MITKEIEGAMVQTMEYAKSKGATHSEVLFSGGTSLSLKAESGALSEHKVSRTQVFGIRLFCGQQVGMSYSEDSSPDSLKKMVDVALETLQYTPEKPHETLHAKDQLISDPLKEMTFEKTDLKEKIQCVLDLEALAKKRDSRVKSLPYNGYSEGENTRAMMNSLGGICFERYPFASCYTSVLMEDGSKQATHYESDTHRDFTLLNPQRCAENSVKYAADFLTGETIKSGSYRVFFSPNLLSSFFNIFSTMFSGKALVEGTHPLKDKIGKIAASPLLTVTDCPRHPEALYPTLFDDEGFLTKDNPLMVDGVLHSLYHNSATAKEAGVANTFNAARGPRSSLSVSSTTKVISTGQMSEQQLKSLPVFEIVGMQGLHSGANVQSGNFSFGATGYLWENGEIVQVVRGVTVSGNFYEAINHIEGIGEQQFINTSKNFIAPRICFADLSVAGGK